MTKWSSLTGVKYYHLTVIYPTGIQPTSKQQIWRCSCTCGQFVSVVEGDLLNGKVSSCGCLPPIIKSSKNYGESSYKHGMTNTPEYRTWASMKQRCYNQKAKGYEHYGGRGIGICPDWLGSFERFYADMGRRPEPRMSIDRIDNDGNYEPGNCRWATASQQNLNKRKSNGDT